MNHSTSSYSLINRLSTLLDRACDEYSEPIQLVESCAPQVSALISEYPDEVEQLIGGLVWPEAGSDEYSRQPLWVCPDERCSIYLICWLPGQYTPVHDHGTWGVVSVLRGELYEHLMSLSSPSPQTLKSDETYMITPTGLSILTSGSVNTFIPEPEHIHRSGVPVTGSPTVSLHLYGRRMTHYHIYDLEHHTRERFDVE